MKLKQIILPFRASSSHCLVIKRYRGDSGHTGNKINCNMAGHIANPVNKYKINCTVGRFQSSIERNTYLIIQASRRLYPKFVLYPISGI